MPTYEYECPTHGEFEETHSIKVNVIGLKKCTCVHLMNKQKHLHMDI